MKITRGLIVWTIAVFFIGTVVGDLVASVAVSSSVTVQSSAPPFAMFLTVNCSSAGTFNSVSLGVVNRGQNKQYSYCVNNNGTSTFFYSTTTSFQQASSKTGSGCGPFASPQFRCPETDRTPSGPVIAVAPSGTLLVSILLSVSTGADPGSVSWTDTSQVYQDSALTTIATSATYSVSLTVQ